MRLISLKLFFIFFLILCSCEFITTDKDLRIERPQSCSLYYSDDLIDFKSAGSMNSGDYWFSNIDGTISDFSDFRIKLSKGIHSIQLRSKDIVYDTIKVVVLEENSYAEEYTIYSLNSTGMSLSCLNNRELTILSLEDSMVDIELNLDEKSKSTRLFPIDPVEGDYPQRDISIPFNYGLLNTISDTVNSSPLIDYRSVQDRRNIKIFDFKNNFEIKEFCMDKLYCGDNISFWGDSEQLVIESMFIEKVISAIIKVTDLCGDIPFNIGEGGLNIVFSSVLNQSGFATGYFNRSDLFPYCSDETLQQYNPSSNYGTYIYIGVPDAAQNGFGENDVLATVVHELQHLIHFYHKSYLSVLSGADEPLIEKLFLDEGMSHLVESLCGYGISGGNIRFVEKYLKNPGDYSLIYSDRGGSIDSVGKRGGDSLLLDYLFWKSGGVGLDCNGRFIDYGGITFIKKIINSGRTGINALEYSTGNDIRSIIIEFSSVIGFCGYNLNDQRDRFTDEPLSILYQVSNLDIPIKRTNLLYFLTAGLLPYSIVPIITVENSTEMNRISSTNTTGRVYLLSKTDSF